MEFPENLPSDTGRLEQIVSHLFPKALHIVLNSRIPSLQSRGVGVKKSDKWFNLVMGVGDGPAALDKLHSWHRNILDSMIIDIILRHPDGETVIERWAVQYENPLIMSPQHPDSCTRYQKVYKKAIILLRSLYAQTRLLPAYRVSRQLSSGYHLLYKVSSFPDIFSAPVTETMQEFRFTPLQVPPGRLSASVTYRSDLSHFNLAAHITLPPRIITDYVGSPATDPMRFFPSPGQSLQGTSTTSSSHRPHTWTSGFHRPPNHSFSPALHHSHCSPTHAFADTHQLSPPFSPSASPSTPRHISGSYNVRPGTAPVTIPSSATFNRYISSNFSEPSRNPLPPFSPKCTRRSPSSQDSLPGLMNHYPAHKVMCLS